MARADLLKEAKNAPDKPGVYLFKNRHGRVLYVGKAKVLKKRVRSYFAKNPAQSKVKRLVEASEYLDFYVTATEVEALVLECNLIKQYRPKFNVSYMDDKSYPFLAVSLRDQWPRVRFTREKHRSKTRYFGPYTNAHALRETLDTLLKIFPLRTCSDSVLERAIKTDRACLYFHIGRCPGPCVGRADEAEYSRTIERICAFLEGRQEQVVADLGREMEAASVAQAYARAAVFRDRIQAASRVREKQRVAVDAGLNQDIFGLAVDSDLGCVQWLKVRSGKLIGSEDFIVNLAETDDDTEILTSFIKQYYSTRTLWPDEIVLPGRLDEPEAIAVWLSELRGRKIKLTFPQRGLKRRLVDMATENAWHSLARYKLRADHESKTLMAALLQLQDAIGLPAPPATIECYDISNIGGEYAVGSMVVFIGGQAAKQAYRRFKIKGGEGRPDDYAMLKEVLYRRLTHDVKDPKFAARPDLIIVDGGKGQLSAAQEAFEAAGAERIGLAALAKQDEELFIPGAAGPIRLPDRSPGLHLVQRVRDEAHRFAVEYHRNLRSKALKSSGLDDVPGVGRKRRQLLLTTFGSLKKVREATESDLVGAGLPRAVARKVKDKLG